MSTSMSPLSGPTIQAAFDALHDISGCMSASHQVHEREVLA
jgi:hypothetical protein